MELERTPDGVTVLNDAYNANPTSADAALRGARRASRSRAGGSRCSATCASSATTREPSTPRSGALAAELGVDVVVGVGAPAARSPAGARARAARRRRTSRSPTRPPRSPLVADLVRPGDAVLVKASRAVGLERVADALMARGAAAR